MELREMNVATADETAELLPSRHDDNESYFMEYAIQKEIINRNRCPASRRLLSQTAHLADFNVANSNHHQKESPCAGISIIHTSGPNWPPSRKREEARALENLRKRVEQSKLFKANQISDPGGSSASTSTGLNTEQLQQLDNRPKLLKKVTSSIFYGKRTIHCLKILHLKSVLMKPLGKTIENIKEARWCTLKDFNYCFTYINYFFQTPSGQSSIYATTAPLPFCSCITIINKFAYFRDCYYISYIMQYRIKSNETLFIFFNSFMSDKQASSFVIPLLFSDT
ncbi:uncharacterized protein LOC107271116 isoform X1 [Cephus cinctus]|uniref:Uncharacterized protein LOC107271116 isoform X1 n=1 Tax=Cephus cinctus TaxID=211228 RepID=A0AAJ7W4D6_CEPCN|nr:uncharacterized protein LOC107271116 isoform X1 [Cephus cinctus]